MKFKMEIIARNIVNIEAITEFVNKVSKGQSDKIKIWCNTILKNYLKNEYNNLKEVTKSKNSDPEWLQEAVKRKDAQEIIIDKRFERLLIEHILPYFDTLHGANIKYTFPEAEKKIKKLENKKSIFNIKLIKGVKEILKCDKGYTWFEIIDEETLYNEGECLQNCLREREYGPKYWDKIKNKVTKIFTLRDSKGICHVGVEYYIINKFISKMIGKQDSVPIKIYHPYCIELLKYLKCDAESNILSFLNVINVDNQIYDIYNLPNNLKIKTFLDLTSCKITKLPDNLKVNGGLRLSYTKIVELPDNLTVTGNLFLNNTNIQKLPNTLKVDKFIYISKNMRLEYVPKHLTDKIKIL